MGKTKIQVVGEETPSDKQSLPLRGKQKDRKTERQKKLEGDKKVRVAGLKGGERVVLVGAEPVPTETPPAVTETETEKKTKKQRPPRVRGKRYLAARTKVDPGTRYSLQDAVKMVKETSISRFPGSVEVHLVLGKEAVNTQVELPFSSGKTRKVEVADDATIEKLKAGKIDFDVLLATPDMMPKLVPFAKILGPRGLMPNPKQGTIVKDPGKAKEKFGGNRVSVKSQKDMPIAHLLVGKVNQKDEELEQNIQALFKAVGEKNIKKMVLSASMGPGIKVAVS